jgi:tetratricopeptide (TPR) repeat protein
LALSYSWRGDCYKALKQFQFAIDSYDKAYKVSGNEIYLKEKKIVQDMLEQLEPKKKRFFGLF